MEDLIKKLMAEGLTEAQAMKAIEVIKDYAKSKLPLFSGAINKMFEKFKSGQDDDFLN
ncbi:MAG: hypothetical protein WAU24_09535 [Chitinophagaceae bacterium]